MLIISDVLRRIAAALPEKWHSEIKRMKYRRLINNGNFKTSEPEYDQLPQFVGPGNWVIDIGANIGHYTRRLSEIVGPGGRVLAFEPVPETFSLLSANLKHAGCLNVSLINAAVSDKTGLVGMDIPYYQDGLKNYYEAHLTEVLDLNKLTVLSLNVDRLALPHSVSLVKIDAEGHEMFVLTGMVELLRRDHPVLIVESGTSETVQFLSNLGYECKRYPGSPNAVFSYS
jgi:FkbM family methyltransferase